MNEEIKQKLNTLVNNYLNGYCDPRIRDKYKWLKRRIDE